MRFTKPWTLVLIRHGESLRNQALNGQSALPTEEARTLVAGLQDMQVPLTEIGKQQARETGYRIIDALGLPSLIVHSGSLRTTQTVEEMCRDIHPGIRKQFANCTHIVPALRERSKGYAWHMTGDEVREHFPYLQEHHDTTDPYVFRYPGGESIADLVDGRVRTALLEIVSWCGEHDQLWVVGHGFVQRALRILLEESTWDEANVVATEPIPNLGVTAYRIGDEAVLERIMLNRVFWQQPARS